MERYRGSAPEGIPYRSYVPTFSFRAPFKQCDTHGHAGLAGRPAFRNLTSGAAVRSRLIEQGCCGQPIPSPETGVGSALAEVKSARACDKRPSRPTLLVSG